MNRSGTQPERDRGNSSIEQEPGRPGSPAPKALESGRIHRPKKATECSVNYSPKCFFWPVQADRVSNIDVNGNESGTLGAYTGQRRHFGE